MEFTKKAVHPVVATALLLVVAVIAVVSFQGWFDTYSADVLTDVEKRSENGESVELDKLVGSYLYVKNSIEEGLNVTKLMIDNQTCSLDSLSLGINEVDVSSCLANLTTSVPYVVLVTDSDVVEKQFYIKDGSASLAGGAGGGAPVCNYNAPENFHGGSGTLVDPWQICDCGQLQNVSNYLRGNFTLANNVDCSATSGWNGGAGFAPIGGIFNGTFDGAGYAISNLYIYRPTSNNVALFNSTYNVLGSSPFINDLTLSNVNITGVDYVSGLVGVSEYHFFIDNVDVSGYLYGEDFIGGVLGYEMWYADGGIVSDSSSNLVINGINDLGGLIGGTGRINITSSNTVGSITGTTELGGLSGRFEYGRIDNSYSSMNVVASVSLAGGLVGALSYGRIDNSYATGTIDSVADSGGLVGRSRGSINSSYATGDVTATGNNIGGLIGQNQGSYDGVDNSYATGDVSGDTYVGGLVGYNSWDTVDNSYATGSVTGTDSVGGLIGFNSGGNVNNLYSVGAVSGSTNVGGLIGQVSGGSVGTSYWDTVTSGQASSAGTEVAKNTAEMMQQATYSGWDFASVWQIVEGVSYPTLR